MVSPTARCCSFGAVALRVCECLCVSGKIDALLLSGYSLCVNCRVLVVAWWLFIEFRTEIMKESSIGVTACVFVYVQVCASGLCVACMQQRTSGKCF